MYYMYANISAMLSKSPRSLDDVFCKAGLSPFVLDDIEQTGPSLKKWTRFEISDVTML